MTPRQLIQICIVILGVCSTACKERAFIVTHERTALMSICSAMNNIVEAQPNVSITNWTQLVGRFNFDYYAKLAISDPESFPLQRHYAFIEQEIGIESAPKVSGRVILMRLQPIKDRDGHSGRGIISFAQNRYFYTWMWEPDVQTMLRRARVALPEPDQRAAQSATDAARREASKQKSERMSGEVEAAKVFTRTWPERVRGWIEHPIEEGLRPLPVALALFLLASIVAFVRVFVRAWKGRNDAQK